MSFINLNPPTPILTLPPVYISVKTFSKSMYSEIIKKIHL